MRFAFRLYSYDNSIMTNRSWTDQMLTDVVNEVYTFKDVMIGLGLVPGGGNESRVRQRIKDLGLDTSHFRKGGYGRYKTEPDDLFRKGMPFHTGHRRHYLRLHEYKCSECGISEWLGLPLTLQLDHADGDRTNNELTNLRLLCPNCHSQTSTWARQKKFIANS